MQDVHASMYLYLGWAAQRYSLVHRMQHDPMTQVSDQPRYVHTNSLVTALGVSD